MSRTHKVTLCVYRVWGVGLCETDLVPPVCVEEAAQVFAVLLYNV